MTKKTKINEIFKNRKILPKKPTLEVKRKENIKTFIKPLKKKTNMKNETTKKIKIDCYNAEINIEEENQKIKKFELEFKIEVEKDRIDVYKYTGEEPSESKMYFGKLIKNDKLLYEGGFKGNYFYGIGTYSEETGNYKYTFDFVDGYATNLGRIERLKDVENEPKGTIYKGFINKDYKIDGLCIKLFTKKEENFKIENEKEYIASWDIKNQKTENQFVNYIDGVEQEGSTIIFENGDELQTKFRDGKKIGVFYFQNGCRYEYYDDSLKKKGILYKENGDSFKGEWKLSETNILNFYVNK